MASKDVPHGDKDSDAVNGSKSNEPPSNKRRRVALACNACRCDGERPKCRMCSSLGFECVYEATESSTNVIVKKEYVTDFESRLKAVEDTLKRHDEILISYHPTQLHRPQISTQSTRYAPQDGSFPRESIRLDATDLQDHPAEEVVTDGMAMSFVDEFDSVFFGATSAQQFTRHILGAMSSQNISHPKTLSARTRSTLGSSILDYSRPPSPSSPEVLALPRSAIYELPPVEELETHLNVYFQNTGLLFPFIHEPSFMETYRLFKASGYTKTRRTWLGLLNIVLAMACSMDPNTPIGAISRAKKSDIFYKRAVSLCGRSSLRGANLETVQYLLLTSQYLQGTQRSSETWTLHGLAVKAVFALGLHLNQPSRVSPLDNEIRKRTFFGAMLLDRVLSMTFGRPLSIPEEYIRLPMASIWPDHTVPSVGLDLHESSTAFFNASVKLHRIIGTAINRLYGHNLGYDGVVSEHELRLHIAELEQELNRWQLFLPQQLKVVFSTSLPDPSLHQRVVHRFRTMLTLRYHNLNILIHRPLLCAALDRLSETIPPARPTRATKDSILACLGSAEETINIVHGILTDPSLGAAILGAWWFTLYYIFNASLVVFANSLLQRASPQDFSSGFADAPQDIEHLNRSVDALRLLDRENRIVDRCTEYVEYLLKVTEQQRSGAMTAGNALNEFGADGSLPDLNDFLKDDLELAQFFASGIFDMQSSGSGIV